MIDDELQIHTLPDLGYDILPHWDNTTAADIYVRVACLFTIVRFLFTPMRITILRRWLD
jgi:hypothetical protein